MSSAGQLKELFSSAKITSATWNDLEDILIMSDVGINTTTKIITELKSKSKKISDNIELISHLKDIIRISMTSAPINWTNSNSSTPLIILMVGVNGAGKTTTIGKLTYWYQTQAHSVILGAGDTYRAAASEQLEVWGDRLNVTTISHSQGGDPGAVTYDTIHAAKSRKMDIAIIDTAGRLQNKSNLMKELDKMHRIAVREAGEKNVKILLTIDATTGQNGLIQAKEFTKSVSCDSVFLSKLDGSAKGGIVLPISSELMLPISFIGTGENESDLELFDAAEYTDGLINISAI